MTVGQALAEFLARQWTVDGEIRERTIPAVLGIFGHGNVAGVGQALKQLNVQQPDLLPYHPARNEQAMVHQAVGYARVHRRRATLACTASVGPGAANMLTGGLKSWLCDSGSGCAISTPAIIRGNSFAVEPLPGITCERLVFKCGEHYIAVEIHIKLG